MDNNVGDMNRFLTEDEIDDMGFRYVGKNTRIARTATITEPKKVDLGDNCLISDYCLITGRFSMGDWCHLAHYSHISGHHGVYFGNHVGVSARCSFYTSNDNFKGESLWGPCPDEYCKKEEGPIVLNNHVLIGWNCLILPDTYIGSCTIFNSSQVLRGTYKYGYRYYQDKKVKIDAENLSKLDVPKGQG